MFAAAGANPDDAASVDFAREIFDHPLTEFAGIYSHCGQTYNCRSAAEIRQVSSEVAQRLTQFAKK